MRITPKMLRDRSACVAQVEVFEREWPDGCVVTTETAQRAVALGLDIDWAARNLLSAPALAEYNKITAPAWAEYDKIRAPALAEYNKIKAPALAEYEKIRDAAWAEYEKITASAFVSACDMQDKEA